MSSRTPSVDIAVHDQSEVGRRGFFYVGGEYIGEDGRNIMRGQSFVEVIVPRKIRKAHPLVFVHGTAQTSTCWLGTPDGRRGDPAFDAFYASQVETLASSPQTERAMQAAGVALLDKIGPAILVTHSQAAYFGWLVTDQRPWLVKGNIAIEPAGPPCENLIFGTGANRRWGLTNVPLTYEPALAQLSDLRVERFILPDAPHLAPCWQQEKPARQLPNLKGIPTLVLVSEASYHATFAHCTARWLKQAGVTAELLGLEDKGIHGNGHMMMLELNNLEIASLLNDWIETNVH